MADVDFGDMLDYLAADPGTRAILLYIEPITHARKFMSTARAAARNKPVLVVKVGRFVEAAHAAAAHRGALAGADAVYEAAFRRSGMLRVDTMAELFDAVVGPDASAARRSSCYSDQWRRAGRIGDRRPRRPGRPARHPFR
jgi:acetyltransferase